MTEQNAVVSSVSPREASPDLLVEEQILNALSGEGLIDDALAKKLKGKIASGSMKADDWRVDFELALSKKKNGAEADHEPE